MQTYTDTIRLFTNDIDLFGLWKPDSIFRFMQEIAGDHSTKLGFARENIVTTNLVWMLVRAELVVKRYPGLKDSVTGLTWYGTPGKITYPRYVQFCDDTGEQIAFMATSWVVVDLAKRSIQIPARNEISFPPAADIIPTLAEPQRLKLSKAAAAQVTCRTVMYSDLDINGHMNNACYISWLMDLFPVSWHEEYALSSLHIDYLAEAHAEQEIELYLYGDNLDYEVQGLDKASNKNLFNIKVSFRKK